MSGLPWFKCYPRDFNDGLSRLTLEERGAYITIINHIYIRGTPVEDDPTFWRATLLCSGKTWAKIRAALIVKRRLYAVDYNGVPCLMDERCAKEIEQNEETRRKLSERGSRGGRKAQANARQNNDLAQAPAQAEVGLGSSNTEAESEAEERIDREAIASLILSFACALERVVKAQIEKRIASDFRVFWDAYPRRVAKDAAEKSFAKAWRKIGTENPLAVILAGIERALPGWDDRTFIPHPATWLNQGRWDDEPPPIHRPSPTSRNDDRQPSRPSKLDHLADVFGAMGIADEFRPDHRGDQGQPCIEGSVRILPPAA